MITASQIHWIAGLLEGEGSFTKTTPASRLAGFSSIRIGLSMTDKDIILRLANLLGFGSTHIYEPSDFKSGFSARLKQYRWECSGRAAAGLMMTILAAHGRAQGRQDQRAAELLETKQSRSTTDSSEKDVCFQLNRRLPFLSTTT